jgi:hypothetical protein
MATQGGRCQELAIFSTVTAPAIPFRHSYTYCGPSTYWPCPQLYLASPSQLDNFRHISHTHVVQISNILNLFIDIIPCNLGLVWTRTVRSVTPVCHAKDLPISVTHICSVWSLHVEPVHGHHRVLSAAH